MLKTRRPKISKKHQLSNQKAIEKNQSQHLKNPRKPPNQRLLLTRNLLETRLKPQLLRETVRTRRHPTNPQQRNPLPKKAPKSLQLKKFRSRWRKRNKRRRRQLKRRRQRDRLMYLVRSQATNLPKNQPKKHLPKHHLLRKKQLQLRNLRKSHLLKRHLLGLLK